MLNDVTLEEAERAIHSAQSELQRLNAQHASASEALRLAEGEKERRRTVDDPAVFARSVRECNAAQAECERIEALIATAQSELERATEAASEPRRVAALVQQQRLDAIAADLAREADGVLRAVAALFAGRQAMEALQAKAEASKGLLRQLAGNRVPYCIPPELERATEVGWLVAVVRRERLQSPENRASLAVHERALRTESQAVQSSPTASAEACV